MIGKGDIQLTRKGKEGSWKNRHKIPRIATFFQTLTQKSDLYIAQKWTLTRGMSPYHFVGESPRAYAMVTDVAFFREAGPQTG